jgi:hypothetical protein
MSRIHNTARTHAKLIKNIFGRNRTAQKVKDPTNPYLEHWYQR